MRCAVYGCCQNNNKNINKSGNENISYHSFPKQNKISKQWVFLCRRSDKFNIKTARICSKHFMESDFVPLNSLYEQYGISLKKRRLKDDAVPSILLPLTRDEQETSARDLRAQNRHLVSCDGLSDKENVEVEVPTDTLSELSSSRVDCPTQTDVELRKMDCGIQTKPVVTDGSTQTEEAKPTYSELQDQITKLKAKNWKQQQVIDSVSHIFAKGQLKKLEPPHKRVKWSSADIANAIAIYAAGPRAYRLLLRKHYPLPAVITLKKWCSKLKSKTS